MQQRLLVDGPERTWAIVLATGDEVMGTLKRLAVESGLSASRFTAIGAFRAATLGYYRIEGRSYDRIPIAEQVEVLSLIGDVTLDPAGAPQVHAHAVVGRADGSTRGGHLLDAIVRPTLEILLTESPAHLRRRHDAESGLALIDLAAEEIRR